MAQVADTVVVAVVALGGTVVGGLIAGGVQVALAKMTRAGQLEVLERQAEEETNRIWREHRRQVYADFQTATLGAISQFMTYAAMPPGATVVPGDPTPESMRASRDEANRAYSDLSLVAGHDVRDLCYRVVRLVEANYRRALRKEKIPERGPDLSHEAVVVAMQKELGLHRPGATPTPSP
jgi:hypothetical protein